MSIHYTPMDIVEEKIGVLRDFKVLLSNASIQEATMRNILTLCKSDIRMEQKLHNVLYGNEPLRDLIDRDKVAMHKSVFTTVAFEHPHIGYTLGDEWNGFAVPYFEMDEARVIMKEVNAIEPKEPMKYTKRKDAFVLKMEDGEVEIWQGKNYLTTEGVKHLYGIGAYTWSWETVTQADFYAVAQRVENFLYGFDTYEYRNQYDNREEVVDIIVEQLKDFKTLKQVLIALCAEELTEQELFDRLGKELKV